MSSLQWWEDICQQPVDDWGFPSTIINQGFTEYGTEHPKPSQQQATK